MVEEQVNAAPLVVVVARFCRQTYRSCCCCSSGGRVVESINESVSQSVNTHSNQSINNNATPSFCRLDSESDVLYSVVSLHRLVTRFVGC